MRKVLGVVRDVLVVAFILVVAASYVWPRLSRKSQDAPSSKAVDKGVPPVPGDVARVSRAGGGSIRTTLGFGYVLSKDSSLNREWIFVHQPKLPVDVAGTPGIATTYKFENYGGSYHYQGAVDITPKVAIRAVEVRFLVFDVWGDHVQNLSLDDVADIPAGVAKHLPGTWNLLSENQASTHYASIGFVARVRLEDGRVITADPEPVLAEARKFSGKFTAEDLEPKKPAPPAPKA